MLQQLESKSRRRLFAVIFVVAVFNLVTTVRDAIVESTPLNWINVATWIAFSLFFFSMAWPLNRRISFGLAIAGLASIIFTLGMKALGVR